MRVYVCACMCLYMRVCVNVCLCACVCVLCRGTIRTSVDCPGGGGGGGGGGHPALVKIVWEDTLRGQLTLRQQSS